jgi:hypothetical protein
LRCLTTIFGLYVLQDVETLRALEEALREFPGCAVVISHDRCVLPVAAVPNRRSTATLLTELHAGQVVFGSHGNPHPGVRG